jgi:hypothetical protein
MASNTFAQTGSVTGSAVTSIAKSFAGACTSGSKIVAMCTGEDSAGTHTVADNGNAGNYTQDKEAHTVTNAATGVGRATANSKSNTSTAALQVTVTFSGSTYGSISIYEITNAGGTPAFDSSGSQVDDAGSTAASVSITTVAANCSVLMCGTHYASGAGTDTEYTARLAEIGVSLSYHKSEDNVDVGAAGAKTLTWNGYTDGVSAHMVNVAAGYAPPSASAGVTYPQLERFGHRGAFRGMLN